MSLAPPLSGRQAYDQRKLRSRALHHWRSDHMKLDALAGADPVFSRAATATATGQDGETLTYPEEFPAWQWTSGRPGLLLGTSDELYYPWEAPFQEMSGVIEFVQVGNQATGADSIWHIGPVGAPGGSIAALWIRQPVSTGQGWRLFIRNTGGTVDSSFAGEDCVDGDVVRIRWQMENTSGTSYRVQLWQARNGGSEVTNGASSAVDMGSGFSAPTRHYIASAGGEVKNPLELRKDLIAPGVLTSDQLDAFF